MSPLAKYLLPVTQLPTIANVNPYAVNNYIGTWSPCNFQFTTATRIDHKFGEKDSFYGRYSVGDYRNLSQFYGIPSMDWSKVPGNTQGTLAPNWSFAFSHVHTFSPTFFNEFLVTGTRTKQDTLTGDPTECYDCELGLPNPFNTNQWPGLYNLAFRAQRQRDAVRDPERDQLLRVLRDHRRQRDEDRGQARIAVRLPLPPRPHEPPAPAAADRRQLQLGLHRHGALRPHHLAHESRRDAVHRRPVRQLLPGHRAVQQPVEPRHVLRPVEGVCRGTSRTTGA